MACTTNNICFDVCLVITITPGNGISSSVNCDGTCGNSPSIEISPTGSIIITLPLIACFSITLNDDLSVASQLTSLSFQTS
ncbi:hypothetical protein ACO11K_000856 [Bacillus cytotoxicus]|uniref:hypothetical protein n=1 Tax=unclassified Bacillus cereus group TaxID=2750818 RepID=UPI001F59E08A|nr:MULTISPECIES: hypothetical protein [unclassified Bacillus cereus group]EMA6343013.1 hypothetical protein [Bacillus cytotoxicus]